MSFKSKLGETMLLENILIIEGILETINNIYSSAANYL